MPRPVPEPLPDPRRARRRPWRTVARRRPAGSRRPRHLEAGHGHQGLLLLRGRLGPLGRRVGLVLSPAVDVEGVLLRPARAHCGRSLVLEAKDDLADGVRLLVLADAPAGSATVDVLLGPEVARLRVLPSRCPAARWWVGSSAMPPSSTRTRSAQRTRLGSCEMMIVVLPRIRVRRAPTTRRVESASRPVVGSSSTRIGACRMKARAIAMR